MLGARTYLHLGDIDAAGREADGALGTVQEADDPWSTGWALNALADHGHGPGKARRRAATL